MPEGVLSYAWLPGTETLGSGWARVGLALPHSGRVVGVLSLTVRSEEQEFRRSFVPSLAPFTALAAAAVQRLQAAEASHRRWLGALEQLSKTLVSHTDLDEFLAESCDVLLSVTEMELATVALLEPGASLLRARVTRGLAPSLSLFYDSFPIGERLSGRAACERTVRVYRDLARDESESASVARAIGLDTAVCVPLCRRDQLLGVLFLGSRKPCELPDDLLDLIVAVGHQITAAVDHAVLLDQTRQKVEEHRARSEELRVLLDVSQAMVATNSLEERLHQIARALTQVAGSSHCAIFRREADGLTPWVRLGDTEEPLSLPRRLDLPPEEIRRLVTRSRKGPFVMQDSTHDPLARSEWLRDRQVRAALWLPFHLERTVIGFAVCYTPGRDTVFSPRQRRLAGAIASQAAIAIRMSQAFEHQQRIAERLQSGMRPTHLRRHGRFELDSSYHPALQEARVGGDFYDVFLLPDNRVALLMADVSGKGLSAAVQTTMVKNMLRLIAFEEPEPAGALARLNRALHHFTDRELFVTAFYGVLCSETGELRYANAGHDPPLLYRASLSFSTALDTTGMALGMDAESCYFARRLVLERGDVLLLYTDGITEARRGGSFFGRERLEEALARHADARPTRIVRFLYREARAFSDGALHDDVALLCLKARD